MFQAGMWKRKLEAVEAVNFLWKRKHLIKEGGSESVEKELEVEAIFSKSGASGFSNWLQSLGQNVTIILLFLDT